MGGCGGVLHFSLYNIERQEALKTFFFFFALSQFTDQLHLPPKFERDHFGQGWTTFIRVQRRQRAVCQPSVSLELMFGLTDLA